MDGQESHPKSQAIVRNTDGELLEPIPPTASRAEKLLMFRDAIKAGASMTQASALARVSKPTGIKWQRMIKAEHDQYVRGLEQQHKKRDPTTKEGVLAILREIAADEDQSGNYRTNAASLLLKEEFICDRPCCNRQQLPLSVQNWIEQEAEDADAAMLAAGTCPRCSGPIDEKPRPPQCGSNHRLT